MRGKRRCALGGLDIEYEDGKPARCGNAAVKLSDRAGRRISRIGKRRFTVLVALAVEGCKSAFGHIDLAAHAQIRDLFGKRQRNAAHGTKIMRDVLADRTVASRGTAHKHAVAVFKRHGQAVDFIFDRIGGAIPECFIGLLQICI